MVLDTEYSPHTQSRERIRSYLHTRLSSHPVLSGVVPYVDVLGLQNMLVSTPHVPAGGHTVLPVHIYGHSALLGPLSATTNPTPPCYFCLPLRWQKLRSKSERDVLERGGSIKLTNESPFLTDFALEQLWQVVSRIADPTRRDAERPEPGLSYVYELQLDTFELRRHPIIADSRCPVCARPRPDTAQGASIELRPRRKPSVDSSRLRSPADYGLPFEAFANPVCGMLGIAGVPEFHSTTVAPVTGYLFVRSTEHLFDFFWSGHADAYDDSAILAVLEGTERYAGLIRRGTAEPFVDSYANLAPDALDPRECGVYTDEFYRAAAPHFVPFTPDLRLPWVWGYSLRDRKPILVPERLVYYLSTEDRTNFVQECSNGCATGSCLEEAILYGMLELIERDAFLLAWYGKATLPEIDPRSCQRKATRFMLDRIAMEGYDVRLFDNRIDLPIPVVTAVAVRQRPGLGALCLASGAGLDPEDAVSAALCEIATYVPDFDGRTRRLVDVLRPMVSDYRRVRNLEHHPLLFGLPEMVDKAQFLLGGDRRRPMAEVYKDWAERRPSSLDLHDDLRCCLDSLTGAGFDVIVIDQTAPEERTFGLHTVCVIAPGMIPIDFGWDKQRALTMPRMRTAFRRAGWRSTDLADSELHLVPHPFP